jgi:broad specificity phosphatase PhoE
VRGSTPVTAVYLVRHGQTLWNREQRFQGQLDVPLSDVGKRQATALAAWLRQHAPFGAIYTSDLARAAQTAAAIGRQVGLTPVPVPALREIQCGDWSGLSVADIEQRYPSHLRAWRDAAHRFTLPGGESVRDVQRRVVSFFLEAVRCHRGDSIIIVAHGVALAALLTALQRWNLREAWREGRGSMSNTGVTIIHWDQEAETCSMPLFNSLAHLVGLPE